MRIELVAPDLGDVDRCTIASKCSLCCRIHILSVWPQNKLPLRYGELCMIDFSCLQVQIVDLASSTTGRPVSYSLPAAGRVPIIIGWEWSHGRTWPHSQSTNEAACREQEKQRERLLACLLAWLTCLAMHCAAPCCVLSGLVSHWGHVTPFLDAGARKITHSPSLISCACLLGLAWLGS
ncbi:hypothetical protein ACTXT7_002906 [Hymenolepis weldensis]